MTFKTMLIASAALALPTAAFAQNTAPAATQSPPSASAPVASAAPADQAAAPAADAPTSAAPASGTTADAAAAPAQPAPGAAAQVAAVTQSDLKKGTPVMDTAGGSVGTIESVTADAAVVSTGKSRAQIPLSGFGKTDKGIVLGMTKAELEKAAGGAKASAGS